VQLELSKPDDERIKYARCAKAEQIDQIVNDSEQEIASEACG